MRLVPEAVKPFFKKFFPGSSEPMIPQREWYDMWYD